MGVNTARPGKWSDGRLSERQIERIRERFGPIPERVFKVVVTHHPFIPAPGGRAHALVERGFQALEAAESCGVDLLLAGPPAHDVHRRRAAALPVDPPLDAGRAGGHVDVPPASRRGQHLQLDRRGPAARCPSSSGAGTASAFEPRVLTRYVKRDDEWIKE